MAHRSWATQIPPHGCSEGLGMVSALSPRQCSCQCQVSETTENLKGGEAERKLQGPGQRWVRGGACPPGLSQAPRPTENNGHFFMPWLWPSDAAALVALCDGFAHQPSGGLPTLRTPKGSFIRALEVRNIQQHSGMAQLP